MTLFDTNVLIYVMDPDSPFHAWAARLIVDEAMKGDAAVNAISVAEVCVGAEDPNVVVDDILDWGIQMFDAPTDVVVHVRWPIGFTASAAFEIPLTLHRTFPFPISSLVPTPW